MFQLFHLALLGVLVPVLARNWQLGDRTSFGEVFRLGATVAVALGSAVGTVAILAGSRTAQALFGADL